MNQMVRDVAEWQWRKPSFRRFMRTVWDDFAGFVRARGWRSWHWALQLLVASLIPLIPLVLYMYRHLFQPAALTLSVYADAIAATLLCYVALWLVLRRLIERDWLRSLSIILGIVAFVFLMAQGGAWHRYVGQWARYKSLQVVELESQMPLTERERVLSHNSIYTLARRLRDQTEKVTLPDFVKTKDGGYCWSLAVQPDRLWQQFNDPVDEILCIPGQDGAPDLSKRGLIKVNFEVGENLLFSRNTDSCVRRALGPIRFWSYEPGRVVFIQNDAGEWVQAVPWIKWTGTLGFLFPRPEFGGVQIIEQSQKHPWYRRWFWEAPKRVFLGCGRWIPPQEMHKHAFLRGQNLMPDIVSRSMAESFRFQDGFVDPWEVFKVGDVRIADLPGDVNKQPFTSFYRMPQGPAGRDKLYDSFALEPADLDKKTLVTSFFVPGDGIGPSYVYRHSRKNEAPVGVTEVPNLIKADRPDLYWPDRIADESRYYIRDLADSSGIVKRRVMYLSSVVLVEKAAEGSKDRPGHLSSAIPLIAITDSATRRVAWVDPHEPGKWDEIIRAKFGADWARSR